MALTAPARTQPERHGLHWSQGARLLMLLLREAIGLAVLLGFSVGIATMPPLGVVATDGWFGFRFTINWAFWGRGLKRLWLAFASDRPLTNPQGKPLVTEVLQAWQLSLTLLVGALLLALLLGVLKGVLDFRQLQRRRVALGPLLTAAIQGMPDFFLLMLIQWGVLTLFRETGELLLPVAWTPGAGWLGLAVPLFCLTLYPLTGVARVVTAGLQEVWGADYIRTGRAKGVRELILLWKHAMRNVMVQLLDTLPLLLSLSFANLLILEYLCNIPGLTKLLRAGIGQEVDVALLNGVYRYGLPISVDALLVALSGAAIGLTFWALWAGVRLVRPFVDPRLRGGKL
jgi:ABC-type dipeptide/oligopeptide/nickel transport system permease component